MCPPDMAAGFPRGVILERARRKLSALDDLQKLHHFPGILFVRREPHTRGVELGSAF